jgi:hypothetical protein
VGCPADHQILSVISLVWRWHSRAKNEQAICPAPTHSGEKEASIPMTDVEAVRSSQQNVGVGVYNGARHCFGRDERHR